MRRLAHILALSFGAGLSPVWPGTVGAAVGILFAAALLPLAPVLQAVVLAALLALGIWASAIVAADTGEEDPQIVVIDESFGAAAVVLALPAEPLWWIAGFIAFRAFDILKPWPVNWVQDSVPGGAGIMLDDAAASVFTLIVLLPIVYFIPSP
ncbi:phosphatidylglycerophosphatase A [Stappia sp. ES.058]|uniref:phosphatidylglycerophosphatase A family protein n=1 Tax=Stappia sp. ES.058 TaxID=1881061 RepID=UPI000879A674|nr:phosphatidylglycerophosphatase A [Stappia sp. ES.058]SDU33765.1 phosphatidylglycerophosphatase A [Stappia sp. ES.058]